MSLEHNATIATRMFTEANDDQQYQVLAEICHSDVIIHDPFSGTHQGIEAFRGLLAFFRQAFGEQHTDLHQTIAQGEYVAIFHTHNAKSTGSFMSAAPTGAWLAIPGIELFRFREGKIAEFWRFDADISLMAQLGLIPIMQPA